VQEATAPATASPDAAQQSEGKKKKRRRGRRGRGHGKGPDDESIQGTDAEFGGDDDDDEVSSTVDTPPVQPARQPATPPLAAPAAEAPAPTSASAQRRAGRPAKRPAGPAKPASGAQAQLFAEPAKSAPETAPQPATPEAAPVPQKRRATRKAAAPAQTPSAVEPAATTSTEAASSEPAKPKKAAASRKKASATKADASTESEVSQPPQTAPAPEPSVASAPKKTAAKRPATKRATTKKSSTDPSADNSTKKSGSGGVMDAKLPTFQTKRSGEVTIALERGQDILVQVTRESYASKGVRVTTKVTLAGRFLVLLPLEPAIGVSRKIMSVKERRRLRRIARSILPEGHGCIIRTVAQDKDEELIRSDLQKQIETWQLIEQRVKAGQKPGLIYKEQSIAATVMRDLFTPDITRVVIDSKSLHKAIREYVEWAAPALAEKIELYSGESPIFEAYGIERELEKMMFDRKVYLPSGGYIILEQTEAMMVIDVNSGRYAGNKEQELNSLKTNIEAAREIARQIRLRDIGGLLVVDFIDLYEEKNRKKVYDELKNHLRRDRAKSVVLPMTQFGLVQMTRQRVRQQVLQTLSEGCPTCAGSGLVPSKSTVARKIERWLFCFKETSREFRLTLAAHPSVISYLTEGSVSRLTQLMLKHFVRIKVIPNDSLPVDQFQFFSVRQQIDITEKYMPKE
jgi:ribonuclease G